MKLTHVIAKLVGVVRNLISGQLSFGRREAVLEQRNMIGRFLGFDLGALSATGRRGLRLAAVFALVMTTGMLLSVLGGDAKAEYGDVVINNYSDKAGMRPVIFPHWFHRIRFTCKVCHADLGFKFKAGGNDINMLKIFDGQFCGACHNSQIAWGVENCILCHTAKPGTPIQVHESTIDRLVVRTSQRKSR